MTPGEISQYLAIALASLSLLGHLKSYASSGEKQLATNVDALGKEVASGKKTLVDHDRRIQAVEGEMKHLPDREQAHRLELAMEKISGRLDTLDEKLKPIVATNERLQELLMEQARK